ncbi:fuconate dehydratase [Natronosporangium hydrolyticum]|uniref:L-fuconate dehydratase n=1 Tax=Natronosporangium hydrolyticum TaxID=2811111 RepID=A0A895YMV1_9ACTN|nr:enolase C-terminal domain-like protein [Natronosporangium hydrolyticum]QSB16633.1 fuconate dehydratase [Natronosporangium hydrolyticum]
MATIKALDTHDLRFPTSRQLDGSDAMNPDPDYSAAYVVLRTDESTSDGEPLGGYGLVFTIGRGNDVQTAAVDALRDHVVGTDLDELCADLGGFARRLTGDSQLRWLGPEKGVMHMAIGGVVNAAWDLAARRAGKPLWRFISDLTPDEIVACIDWRYLTDALTPDEARAILTANLASRDARRAELAERGYPAYTTSPGWLGYSDDKLAALCRSAVADGYRTIKLKVGRAVDEDLRRLRVARATVGPEVRLAVDANQRWDVAEAVDWLTALAGFDLAWAEEPTSPDDILGHAAIRRGVQVPISTGEHTQNRIVFKQLLQAEAVDLIQIDATRVGGVDENLAILLLAHKFGVPVYPHAGGVGLCELVQHLAMADFVAISGSMQDRAIEYVDHLHEHFTDPVRIVAGRYQAPTAPGMGGRLTERSVAEHSYPDGPVWRVATTEQPEGGR